MYTVFFCIRPNVFILHSCDHELWQTLTIKPTRCTNFSILFWNETLHVLDSSSVRHQELFTVHSAMVYVIQTAFEQQDQDGTGSSILILLLESCLQTCMTYTYVYSE
jgi:hypothetical protein